MYEAYVEEARGEAGRELTREHIDGGLNAVAVEVFPHRALFFQKRWMQSGMRKPRSMTTRQTVAAIGRINNALPLFPGAHESDKFTEDELLQIIEWMVPQEFRTKFEEKGYIPSDFDRKQFLEEAEIIEQAQSFKPRGRDL